MPSRLGLRGGLALRAGSLPRQESCRIKRSFSAALHVAQGWGLRAAAKGRVAADLGGDGEGGDWKGGRPSRNGGYRDGEGG
jgi:hypothetical protein